MCLELLGKDDNNTFYADSAYSGSPIAEGLPGKPWGQVPCTFYELLLIILLQYLTLRVLARKNIGMFSSYVSSDELNERYLRVLDDSWITLFVNAIKYFVENIERRSDFQEFI